MPTTTKDPAAGDAVVPPLPLDDNLAPDPALQKSSSLPALCAPPPRRVAIRKSNLAEGSSVTHGDDPTVVDAHSRAHGKLHLSRKQELIRYAVEHGIE